MSHRLRVIGILLVASMLGIPAHAADEPIVVTSGRVRFVSGGVGETSDARMHALGKEFNLRLLFAAKDGHYLADVAVTIRDESEAKILDTVAEGPWLLATLPPGRYAIAATYAGKQITRKTTITGSARREVFFRWEELQPSGGAHD